MLYVGSFSFDDTERATHNQFVYFAEAKEPAGAVAKFKTGIMKAAEQSEIHIYGEIFLESFIELKKLPREGAMAFLQFADENEASSIISCSNPGVTAGLAGYHWTEDGAGPDDAPTPFLTIPAR